jgi:hypothetical protein
MTTRKTINTEIINKNGIEIIIKTIQKTIHLTDPYVKKYFKMTINGNAVGSNEMGSHQVAWYTKNCRLYK